MNPVPAIENFKPSHHGPLGGRREENLFSGIVNICVLTLSCCARIQLHLAIGQDNTRYSKKARTYNVFITCVPTFQEFYTI